MPVLQERSNDDDSRSDDSNMNYHDQDEKVFPPIPVPTDQAVILTLDTLTLIGNDLDENIDFLSIISMKLTAWSWIMTQIFLVLLNF